MASYLYLKDRYNNIDDRPVVAVVAGINVPQYPIKASELDTIFNEIDSMDILEDLEETIKEAVNEQQETFKKIACERYGVIYNSCVSSDMEVQRIHNTNSKTLPPYVALYASLWASYYNSYYDTATSVYIDDICVMYGKWRADKLRKDYPQLAKGIEKGVFCVCYAYLFYITADYDKLYSYAMFTGDSTEESNTDKTADNITDVTDAIWQGIKKYLGLYGTTYASFEDWAAEQMDVDVISDIVSEMLWGFKGCVMIKKIGGVVGNTKGAIMMNISEVTNRQLRLILILIFLVIILLSFVFVPKERSRENSKNAITVDYVFCSTENYNVYVKVLDDPSEGLERLNRHLENRGNIRKDLLEYESNKAEDYKPLFTYKTVVKQRPYVKTRFDIIFRNIMISGSFLCIVYTITLLYIRKDYK